MNRWTRWAPTTTLAAVFLVGAYCRIDRLADPAHDDARIYALWTCRMLRDGPAAVYRPGGRLLLADGGTVRVPTCNYPVLLPGGWWLAASVVGLKVTPEEAQSAATAPGLGGLRAFLKAPALLGDLTLAALLAGWLWRRGKPWAGVAGATLVLADPVLFYVSAVWGQTDSCWLALWLAAWLSALEGRAAAAGGGLALALLCKPQAILLAPAWAGALHWARGGTSPRQRWRRATAAGSAAALLAWAPWLAAGSGPELLAPYQRAVGQFRYSTVQAFNFWWLARDWKAEPPTQGWLGSDDRAPAWPALGTDSPSVRLLGLAGFALAAALSVAAMRRRPEAVAPATAFLGLAAFLVLPEMHERYVLAAMPALWATCLIHGGWAWIAFSLAAWAAAANQIAFFPDPRGSICFAWVPAELEAVGDAAAASLAAAAGMLAIAAWRAPAAPDDPKNGVRSVPALSDG